MQCLLATAINVDWEDRAELQANCRDVCRQADLPVETYVWIESHCSLPTYVHLLKHLCQTRHLPQVCGKGIILECNSLIVPMSLHVHVLMQDQEQACAIVMLASNGRKHV